MTSLIEHIKTNAPIITQGKAKIKICADCFLKTYQSELNELSKMRGGRKIRSIPLGSISDVASNESPMIPRLSENLPITILVTKRVGVKGMKLQIFWILLMTIAREREINRKNKMRASVVI